MNRFGKFDRATGEYVLEFDGALCSFEALAATFATSAVAGGSVAATGAAVGVVSGGVVGASAAGVGLLSAGGAGIGFFDILSGGFSVFSALSNLAAGRAEEDALEEEALFEDFAAKQELLKGRKEALDILQREQDALEQNQVNAAASGITGQGSPAAAQAAIIDKAKFETAITRSSAIINAEARLSTGRRLRLDAKAARTAGVTKAVGDIAGFFIRRQRRGEVPDG